MVKYPAMFFPMMKALLFSFLLFLIPGSLVCPQTSPDPALGSTRFDTSGFPLWGKELRRAEIVAFGAFPFMVFFASIAVDTYRCASHDWDRRYAPWPVTAAGPVERTEDEQIAMLSVAAAGSLVIALADFFIVRHKRQKQQEYLNSLPGTPIIIRKPWPEEEGTKPSGEGPSGSEAP